MDITSQYYTCNNCTFKTTQLSRIDDHLQVHADTKPLHSSYFDCFDPLKLLKCTSCDFSTEYLLLLRYHLVHNHDQQQFTLKVTLKTCKQCDFHTHSNYLWIRHTFGTCKGKKLKVKRKRDRISTKRDGKWYLCEKCDYRTLYVSNWKSHVIHKHTPWEEIDWQYCTQCSAKFKTLPSLRQHKRSIHMATVHRLRCAECNYSTHSKYVLASHFHRKHTPPEKIKWVECHQCAAKFKDKQDLKCHIKRHTKPKENTKTNEKDYKCDQCAFRTHKQIYLKRHIISRHLKNEEIDWYNCQHCDYKAKQKGPLKEHIQYMHSETLKLVQCPHCSFTTKWNRYLKFHIARLHSDSPFKCDLCDYQARYQRSVQRHKKEKHEVPVVEWLKCEHCDFMSKYKRNLKIHTLVKHSKSEEVFQCKQCDYNTPSKYYLNNHMRKHKRQTVEATISCAKCPFVATTKGLLTRHLNDKHTDHTKQEKLNCAYCNYFCYNKINLNRHLKMKHKIQQPKVTLTCEHCSYVTTMEKQLERHIFYRHTVYTVGEKQNCSHCTYFCFNKTILAQHLKAKHKICDNIQYECDKCDYKNEDKNYLVSHMYKVHNEGELLECDQCIYKTGCPIEMQKHKVNHETAMDSKNRT